MDVTLGAANANVGNQVVDQVGARCQKLFQDFLEEWHDRDRPDGADEPKYLRFARELVKPERNTLTVSMKDVDLYNSSLAETIHDEYYRIYPYLCAALKNYVQDRTDNTQDKDYYISFVDVESSVVLRKLSSESIGKLTRVTGQVVRTHPVHPELVSGTFTCMDCQTEVTGVEQQFQYTLPSICRNPVCNNRSRFLLDVNKSKFVDFQKVRIQEIQSELPRGCIPRSLDVVLRNENVERAQPGDRCDFVGMLIIVPDVSALSSLANKGEMSTRPGEQQTEGVRGLKSLGVRDLHYSFSFLASSVRSSKKMGVNLGLSAVDGEETTPQAMKEEMSEAEWDTIFKMSQDKNLYQNFINSLFPTIHGNDEVKRGILLMLLGGVHKDTVEGTKLRGDINVCIVGDPSTAKSQLLKQVADFCPRAVYTSGKASSAAGLTAAVVKDEETADFVIEAGALMLADNGVCCIDEFDKMDPHDQVAIHEAMEQQTISITKAGVKACLNARASILAAANPIYGRYDKTKSLRQNIQMSAPIMSRFDLFFILVDDCNEVTDYAIASRIVDLHSLKMENVDRVYQPEEILRYINFSKLFKPRMTSESMEFLVEQYKHIRQRDSGGGVRSSYRITVRQLESMIRLSEAMARLHCSDEVLPKHVKEAYRLLNKSIIRVDQPEVHLEQDDEVEAENEENQEAASAADEAMETDDNTQKKQIRISYEEYRTIANLIVYYLRKKDNEAEERGDEMPNTKKSDVVNWYIEEIAEKDIQSVEELTERKEIVSQVINHLTYRDKVLIPINRTGLAEKPGVEETEHDDVLVVHPNYVADE